ncbi:MAG: hypothetical protein A0129_03270 [Limnobacter sp. CACIAM 66H1]|nr:MAG: hypothetical protein A0129_03270 [Limnobacter sp. CACIAM 66H1]
MFFKNLVLFKSIVMLSKLLLRLAELLTPNHPMCISLFEVKEVGSIQWRLVPCSFPYTQKKPRQIGAF